MDIVTQVAAESAKTIVIAPLIQLIDDVINLGKNREVLETDFSRMKNLLLAIGNYSQDQQKTLPKTVEDWLRKVEDALEEAKQLIDRSDRQQRCLCNIKFSRRIREWNSKFDKLFADLQTDFSVVDSAQQIILSAPQEPQVLLQPLPDPGFVGLGIKSAEIQLQSWLDTGSEVRVIGVYGMAGVGKTSLLKIIYNTCKASHIFRYVIWITVSQNYEVRDLQRRVARIIDLNLDTTFNDIDMWKMQLSAHLRNKKFLLILDDMWSQLDLEELGVTFGHNTGSRVIISTRSIEVSRTMMSDFAMRIQPLSTDEGWELFRRVVFRGDPAPDRNTEDIAREIALECKGLPLAVNVVAAAMIGKTCLSEWELALAQMKTVDPAFPTTYIGVDAQLYQRLKWSYNHLPDSNLKNCFLYCAMFREDEEINVDRLVEMWIAEGLVKSRKATYLMDTGRSYVKLFVDRCLIEVWDSEANLFSRKWNWDTDMKYIKIHDVLRDMAIYISEKEENCFFRAGQNMDKFPSEQLETDCKRISVASNNIKNMPEALPCPNLLSLMLGANPTRGNVPEGFLHSLLSLRILDLSNTNIRSLPKSVGELMQLQYLGLRETCISHVPEEIGNLSRLRFMDLTGCKTLAAVPFNFYQLTSLLRLNLGDGECALRVKDLTKFRSLMRLHVTVMVGSTAGTMGTWLEMRHLKLRYKNVASADGEKDILPLDIENMKKLKTLFLEDYPAPILPDCVCGFQHLEKLALHRCSGLLELPALERLPNLRLLSIIGCISLKCLWIGSRGRETGFPKLETLNLVRLPKLQTMAGPDSGIWNEETMPRLGELRIYFCDSLKKLPKGMEKLTNLQSIYGLVWWWNKLKWEHDNMKSCLDKLFKHELYLDLE